MAEGRDLSVAGDKGNIIAKRKQLVADGADQAVLIATRKIGPADGALKQHIADKGDPVGRVDKHHMAGRVSRAMDDIEGQVTQRDLIVIIQPAVGREASCRRKAVLRCLFDNLVDPEDLFLVRAFNRYLIVIGHVGDGAGMIQMPVGDENLGDFHPVGVGLGDQFVCLATGIDKGAFHGLTAPDQRTVLLERGDGQDADIDGWFGHGRNITSRAALLKRRRTGPDQTHRLQQTPARATYRPSILTLPQTQRIQPMAAYQYIYTMKNLSKTYPGGRELFKNISLSFLPGAKIGVLGINGAGKSTLLKIMAGIETEFTGEAWAADGVKVGYLPQEPKLDESKNVLQNVLEGAGEIKEYLDKFEEVSMKFGEPMTDDEMNDLLAVQADLQEKIDAADGWELERRVEIAMDALRCPPGDADVGPLSGGEKRRVALCKLLLSKPDMLLLDEPTNHLDAESVAWLEHFLEEYTGTVVIVTHDRYFLDNVTGWILELSHGRGYPYEGNYSAWLEQKQKRQEQEERAEAGRQKTLSRELEWIRQSPKARQSKSKARITAYEDLLAAAQEQKIESAQIVIPAGPRLGNVVIESEGLTKAFGDRLLIDNLSFRLPPGGIVGVIGPNGAGKTTLFKMITGKEQPTSGTFRVGETVQLGYIDQSRDSLDDSKNVWEEISDGLDEISLGKSTMASRAYVGRFNFKGPDQQKKVGNLSGGERNRVHLAKMLRSGANVLMLDEPTNDLDVETLRALEDALEKFAGCAVVISHDRWFLDRIATHILAFEGDSHVEWFEGNFEEYEADKKRRLGSDADQPHRIKYKPLAR